MLHVASWYPNPWHSLEGIFVKKQVDLFSQATDVDLVNIQVRYGPKVIAVAHRVYSDRAEGYYAFSKWQSGRWVEILTTALLLFALAKRQVNSYDFLHIHIAYPLLALFRFWKRLVKVQVIISEHWSAYFFNFWLPPGSSALARIKKVFSHGIPVIGVSKALIKDIQTFADCNSFPTFVLPNFVDTATFRYRDGARTGRLPKLFSVNVWREIKAPFSFLEAVRDLKAEGICFEVTIGGFGPLMCRIQDFVKAAELSDLVSFAGKMDEEDIADALSRSDAYVFTSTYETFSVACAEALCCGTPLVGPEIPAIMEYADESMHIRVRERTVDGWKVALREFLQRRNEFDHSRISDRARERFSPKRLLNDYEAVLSSILSRS